jgi:hypothetical protein
MQWTLTAETLVIVDSGQYSRIAAHEGGVGNDCRNWHTRPIDGFAYPTIRKWSLEDVMHC